MTTTDLIVIVPSRGRPENIKRLDAAFTATSTGRTRLLVAIDDDDPTGLTYPTLDNGRTVSGPRLGLAGTLNKEARAHARRVPYIGFMGDDHCPRTPGWDRTVSAELARLRTGIVYGNDLIQGPNLPTAVFMTTDIIRTLGYMVPPGLQHLFLDNYWLTLGHALDAIAYLPDVIIEHVHPIAGKTGWDDGYRRVNDPAVWAADEARFGGYCADELGEAVAAIHAGSVLAAP